MTKNNLGRISFFRPPITKQNPVPESYKTLEEIYSYITGTEAKERTRIIRDLISRGESPRERKNQSLDYITAGGEFSYRSSESLVTPSGLVTIDIDHISEVGLDLTELRESLLKDKEIGLRLLFVSPSGDGLKLLCKSGRGFTDDDSYKEEYYSLVGYIHKTYKIPYKDGKLGTEGLDMTSDIVRSCFLCYDKDAILLQEGEFDSSLHRTTKREIEEEIRSLRGEEPRRRPERARDYSLPMDWDSWKDNLIEAMFERIDSLFPDMDFRYNSRTDSWESPYKLDGSNPSSGYRKEKTIISRDKKFGVLEHGEEPVGIIDYYMRRNSINDFKDAMKDLSVICNVSLPNSVNLPKTAKIGSYKGSSNMDNNFNIEAPGEPTIEEKYSSYLELDTEESLQAEALKKKDGLVTNYVFSGRNGKENLILPSGAITLICGKSSHGKTKFLQNLALDIAEKCKDGESVLYFGFEESKIDIISQFANMKINIENLSMFENVKNVDMIRHYLQGEDKFPTASREKAKKGIESLKDLLFSGKLRVFYTDEKSQSLCEIIRLLSSKTKVKAVFIDYAQLIYREGNRKSRYEELGDVCEDLRTTAIDLSLPFVLAAQLNRKTDSPSAMHEDNVADSSELTKCGNVIVLLWNSAFKNAREFDDQEKRDLEKRGFVLGEEGKLYVKITKNRAGTPYIDTILDFYGKTGVIDQNGDNDIPKGNPTKIYYKDKNGKIIEDV